MTRTARSIRFLAGSALALALAAPAFAQSSSDEMQQKPPAVEQGGGGMQAPAAGGENGGASTFDSDAPQSTMDKAPAATDPLNSARTDAEGMPQEQILTAQKAGEMVSDEIIGTPVLNPEQQKIGSIDALVIDKDNRVIAGIVSVGGFLGIGAKSVAVNWKEFTFQPEQQVAMLSLSREQLEEAPAFSDREDQAAQIRNTFEGADAPAQSPGQSPAQPPATAPAEQPTN